jgi:tetratricopeptide (TPR) repeat protein
MIKRSIILSTCLIIILILSAEAGMRIFFGNPLQEPDPIGFEYMYRDIYKPFFKKATRANHAFYVPQRGRNAACEFPVEKEANEKRIFLIGGSVVNDWCEGGGKDNILYFESALRKEFPGNDFKVINCGMDGYDSYREYLVVRQILSYQPDLIVIMSGNNEQFNYGSNNLKIYAINKFLRRSWVYRKSQEAIFKVTRRPTNLPGKKARLENFRNNLTRMLEKGRARNVPVILCTLPVDFRDSPPRFSFLYPLDEQFILAQFLLYSGDYSNAIAEFDQFLKSNPDNSPGLYFMGKCFDMAAD